MEITDAELENLIEGSKEISKSIDTTVRSLKDVMYYLSILSDRIDGMLLVLTNIKQQRQEDPS